MSISSLEKLIYATYKFVNKFQAKHADVTGTMCRCCSRSEMWELCPFNGLQKHSRIWCTAETVFKKGDKI